MPVRVDIPGFGLVEFPDSMSADDVNAAAKRLHDQSSVPSSVKPIAANEPDTYWAGALKGAKEGMTGGGKGFNEGLLRSPASFVNGIVSLLTTNPLTTVEDTIAAVKRLPEAMRQSGIDPESWGRDVGDATGQQMIGIAAPSIVKGTVRGAQAAARSPIVAKVGPQLVKHGATAAGAYAGGPFGAIVGAGIGEELANAMRPKPAVVPPPVGRLAGKAPTLDASLEAALNEMRQPPPVAAGPARLPEYPQAATDTMRALQNKPPAPPTTAAVKAVPTASQPVAVYSHIGPDDLPRFKVAGGSDVTAAKAGELGYTVGEVPVGAGRTSSTAARDAALARQAERVAAKPAPVNPNTALKTARDTFAALGETPRPAEVTNTMELILRGKTPEEAVAIVLKNRPATSPAEELARRLGTPTEAARIAAQDLRYTTGQVKSPSAETARGMKGR